MLDFPTRQATPREGLSDAVTTAAPSVPVTRRQRQRDARTVRVAVVGCGAIAQLIHLPVLAGHGAARITVLVDPDGKRAADLARRYGVAIVLDDASKLDPRDADAALIATPPRFHAPVATELMRRGIDVLVEKPLALSAADASEMIAAADRYGRVLAAGYFRRFYHSTRLIQSMLACGAFGRPLRFDVAEGFFFDWPSVTLGSMRKESAGGGVLIDTGSHTIDQLLSLFDGPHQLLEYADDSLGGVESDCRLKLRLWHRDLPIDGVVTLSRTRKLANRFRIECARGVVEWSTAERSSVRVVPVGTAETTDWLPPNATLAVTATPSAASDDMFEAHRALIDDWLGAVVERSTPNVSGASVMNTVRLIDDCYRSAERLPQPWVRSPSGSGITALSQHRAAAPRRVLITGASGFIGCRIAEVLSTRPGWSVRALVHNPAAVSRLARLPVEMIQGNLLDPDSIARAVAGCDVVIHCAYGTSFGRREAAAATVTGTRLVADAASRAGVGRLIYTSTTAVHGTRVEGVLDESTPVRPDDYEYAVSKAKAEAVVRSSIGRGCPAVILRLPNVYGPFSRPYTMRLVDHLLTGNPVIVGSGETPSNTMYVDNVVEAILRAIDAPADAVIGEIFTINDDHETWAEYVRPYATALGMPVAALSTDALDEVRAAGRRRPLRTARRALHNVREVLESQELKALAARLIALEPLGAMPRWAIDRVPGFRHAVRQALRLDRPEIYSPRALDSRGRPSPDLHLMNIYACGARVSSEKARRVLGDFTVVPRPRAMELTIDWCRHAGLSGRFDV